MVGAVTRGADHAKAEMGGFDPLVHRLAVGGLGPTPEQASIKLQGLALGVGQNGQGSGMGLDGTLEPGLDAGVGADVVFVAVCIDDALHPPVFDGRHELDGGMGAAGVDEQAIDPVGGSIVWRPAVGPARDPDFGHRPPAGYGFDLDHGGASRCSISWGRRRA